MGKARQDFAQGVRDSYQRGRQGDEVVVKTLRQNGGPPVAPGMGGVKAPPGRGYETGDRAARSAAQFGPIVGSKFGGGSSE
jgi:hypothetical protein